MVEAVIDNTSKKFPVLFSILINQHQNNSHGEIILRKTSTMDDKLSFQINGKETKPDDYYRMLEMVGLQKDDPTNIVLQGSVEKVSQLSETELFNFIKKMIGTNVYEKKVKESKDILDKTPEDEEKTLDLLEQFEKKLEEINEDKEDFENYQKSQGTIASLRYLIFKKHFEQLQKKSKREDDLLAGARSDCISIAEKENKLKQYMASQKAKQISLQERVTDLDKNNIFFIAETKQEATLEGNTTIVVGNINNVTYFNNDYANLSTDIEETAMRSMLMEAPDMEELDQRHVNEELSELLGQTMVLSDTDLLKLESEIQNIENELFNVEKDLERESKKITTVKSDQVSLQQKINLADGVVPLNLKEQIANLKQQKENKQNLLNEIDSEIENLKKDSKEHHEHLVGANINLNEPQQQYIQLVHDLTLQNEERGKLTELIEKNAIDINHIQHEYKEAQTRLKISETRLETVYKEINFLGQKNLVEVAKERKLEGVYGLLIDQLEIREELMLSFDILIKTKFFGIVVEDMNAAQALIELNKELGGGKIILYPLSLTSDYNNQNLANIADDDNMILLKSHINHKEGFEMLGLEPLITHIVKNSMLVRSYDLAREYSGKYNASCVTPEGEVSYAEGFLTRMGYYDCSYNRLEIYLKFTQERALLFDIESQISYKKQEAMELRDRDLVFLRNMQELNIQKEQFGRSIEAMKKEVLDYKAALIQMNKCILSNEDSKRELKVDLLVIEKEVSGLEAEAKNKTGNKKKMNTHDLLKLKKDLATKITEVDKQNHVYQTKLGESIKLRGELSSLNDIKDHHETNIRLKNLGAEEESLIRNVESKELKKLRYREAFKETVQCDLAKGSKELEIVKAEVYRLENELREIETDKSELESKQKEARDKVSYSSEERDRLTGKMKECLVDQDILAQWSGTKEDECYKEQKKLVKEKKKYTEQDKVLYEQLDEFYKRKNKMRKNFDDSLKNIENFESEIAGWNEQVDLHNNQLYNVFQNNFEEFFGRIVPNGKAELQLVNYTQQTGTQGRGKNTKKTQRTQNLTQQEYGVEIKTSFDYVSKRARKSAGEELSKDMSRLSPGQKTVVSICVLLAMQKCLPTPFYCFDEIDADLDENYADNLVELMNEMKENSQYFLTTFRKNFLDLDNSRYFSVRMVDGFSYVQVIDKESANLMIEGAN